MADKRVSETPVDPQDVARFNKCFFRHPGGCFIWTRSHCGKGFGSPRRKVKAYRFAWEAVHGPIPPKHEVCHTCDVPSCVNPDHLFLGTHAENMRDMSAKGRGVKSKKNLPFGVKLQGRRFQAQIRIGGAKIYLGSFATIEAASAVAQAAKAGASLEVPRGDD